LAAVQSDLTASVGDYIFEPSKEEIIMTLIPKSLKTQLYKAIRDSFASEHGARMTAMHKATDNATDLRNELKLTYNKARQASITNEILEIVGAEALNEKNFIISNLLSQLRGFFLLILDCKLTTVILMQKIQRTHYRKEMLKNIEIIRFLYPVIGKYEPILKKWFHIITNNWGI
jgi:hypothetical protein